VRDNYTLLADSDNPRQVYYVPRFGGIAVNAPSSANPVPRFSISESVATTGFWAGSFLSYLGGTFDTVSLNDETAQKLFQEANTLGISLSPAPVRSAKTKWLLAAEAVEGSRVKADCQNQEVTVRNPRTGETTTTLVPFCYLPDESGAYTRDSNIFYKLASFPVPGNSVTAAAVPFQAVLLPEGGTIARTKMSTGAQWDDLLTARVEWDIKTNTKTRQARAEINWKSTFEQASAFAAIHNNACIDIEMQAFYQKLASCNDPDQCGVSIKYLKDDGTWTNVAPNDPEFITQVKAFRKSIEDELFNQVEAYTTSTLGQVSKKKSAVFTLRANYEKKSLDRHEFRDFEWSPGNRALSVTTDLNISCLKGGFETGRVSWNTEDEGCRALIGQ
jgi:hypothetical protein